MEYNDELLKRAHNNEISSMVELGKCYLWGNGVNSNMAEAVYWIEKAAEFGDVESINLLIVIYSSNKYGVCNYGKALAYINRLIQMEDMHGFAMMGDNYFYGDMGVKKDIEKAMYYWEKASELGDVQTTRNLAITYMKGDGVKKSYERAVEYYLKAMNQGDGKSAWEIGKAYDTYGFMKTDYVKAARFYRRAISLNHIEAYASLANLYLFGYIFDEKMSGIEKALELFKLGAEEISYCKNMVEQIEKNINNIPLLIAILLANTSGKSPEEELKEYYERLESNTN